MRTTRQHFSFSLALVTYCCAAVLALAQESVPSTQKLLAAKTAYLVAVAAQQQPRETSGMVPENLVSKALAQEQLVKAMRKWHRFEIVDDVKTADLVVLVIEWEDHHRWGNTIVCREQLFVFEGGALPTDKSQPLWQGIRKSGVSGAAAAARGNRSRNCEKRLTSKVRR